MLPEEWQNKSQYQKNSFIYYQGDAADCVYYVLSGQVRIFSQSPDGLEKTMAVFSRGNLFGKASFLEQIPRISSAQALEDCELIAVDRDMFRSAIRSRPEFALDLLRHFSGTIRILSRQVDRLAFLSADQRIARYLLDRYYAEGRQATLRCTHQDISDSVGVSRVTVSRVLGQLNWLSTGYGEVHILDAEALLEYVKQADY